MKRRTSWSVDDKTIVLAGIAGLLAAVGWCGPGALLFGLPLLFLATRRRGISPAPVLDDRAVAAPFAALFEHAPIGLCRLALDGRIVCCNPTLRSFLGIDADTLAGKTFAAITCSDDVDTDTAHLQALLDGCDSTYRLEKRFLHAGGRLLWARVGVRLVRDVEGRPDYFIAAIEDIGEQKRSEQLNRAVEEKMRTIVDHAPAAVWMSAPDSTRILYVNGAYESIWGRSKESWYADPTSCLQLVHPDDIERVRQSLATRGDSSSYEINYRIVRDDGELRYIRDIGRSVYDVRGRLQYLVGSAMDISGEMRVRDELHELNSRLREANQRLQESARLDNLTHCLTRTAFFDEAEKALQLEQRYGRSSTLVFFDLNNFKEVNDNFGHHVGDRGLIAFVEQIKARLRTTDELGRYGGDEFVVLLRETDAAQARQLLATLGPVVVDAEQGNSIILRFSAGVACSDDAGIASVDDWMRAADTQMYHQKARRNGR